MQIFFDESGYTGPNLLDPQQPIFALASVSTSGDIAREILSSCFPGYQGNEYKFSNLWRSNRGRRGLTSFLSAMRARGNEAFVWYTEKRYLCFTKAIDNLVEPVAHAAGFDFYADGYSRRYANHAYFGFRQFAPPELLSSLNSVYHNFAVEPSEQNLTSLQESLQRMVNSGPEEIRTFLDMMRVGAERFMELHDLDSFRQSNEFQFTAMMASVNYWQRQTSEPL